MRYDWNFVESCVNYDFDNQFNSLPNEKKNWLVQIESRLFTDNKMNVTEKLKFVVWHVENFWEKETNLPI